MLAASYLHYKSEGTNASTAKKGSSSYAVPSPGSMLALAYTTKALSIYNRVRHEEEVCKSFLISVYLNNN